VCASFLANLYLYLGITCESPPLSRRARGSRDDVYAIMLSIKALPLLLFVASSSTLEVLNGLQVHIPALDCSDAPSLPHTVLCTHTDTAKDHRGARIARRDRV
jgi:hypothetical protein